MMLSGALHLRAATPADVTLLRHWDEQPHVIESDPNDDWQWETELHRELGWREQLIAELDGRPIGFLQIMDPEWDDEQYWGPTGPGYRAIDIWIGEPEYLNHGLGTRMMQCALQRCFVDDSVHTILIDPLARNTRAHRFYARLGFEFHCERRFGDDDCFVFQLSRARYLETTTPRAGAEVQDAKS